MDAINTESLRAASLSAPFQFYITHLPLKRAFDIVFSAGVLSFGLPLFLSIALLIAISSGTNPIYRQRRVGRGGKPFFCFKFRTMVVDSEERLQKLLEQSPESRQEWMARRKLKQDPRIIRCGHFLRRTSLDELPQFLNVFLGHMSVVGPRPISQEEVKLYLGMDAPEILQLRPGITGLWQTSGRSNVSFAERIQMDREYVRVRTFLLDLKLVLKTVPQLMLRKGAY